MQLAPLQRAEMDARWAARRPKATATPKGSSREAASRLGNVSLALSLGGDRGFLFRGRAYAVPPVPWPVGCRVLELSIAMAATLGKPFDHDSLRVYRKNLKQSQRLLWRHVRPIGLGRRLLRMIGLLRNPFWSASEREISELMDFFSQCRMNSGITPWVHPASLTSPTTSALSSPGSAPPGAVATGTR